MNKTIFSEQGKLMRQAIRQIREKAGYTSRELSRMLGKGHSFISNCEVGQRRVDMVEFYWICKACGANPQREAKKLLKEFEG